MTRRSLRGWYLVHKWTSLICTAFLLMLCVTGLPLIFHDEIDAALGHAPGAGLVGPASSGDAPGLLPLDSHAGARAGQAARRGAAVHGVRQSVAARHRHHRPAPGLTGERDDAAAVRPRDRGSGGAGRKRRGHRFPPPAPYRLFLGLPGEFLLGAMGVLFVAALVSGAVLYAPFMRKLDFGTVAHAAQRAPEVAGSTTICSASSRSPGWRWSGRPASINALATPITAWWQATELAEMTAAYAGRPPLPPSRYRLARPRDGGGAVGAPRRSTRSSSPFPAARSAAAASMRCSSRARRR